MDAHQSLRALSSELKDVLDSIATFSPHAQKPPIIDASTGGFSDDAPRQDSVRGLKRYKESVKRDLDILEKFLAKTHNTGAPALSANAPYLVAVWNEVLHAKHPVIAIWDTYSEHGTSLHPRRRTAAKEAGVKVDVVADGGRQWIRVNTTKNSRMLAEFREIDSYLTDSESDEGDDGGGTHRPRLAQTQLDNSVLRMGRALLAAARENPLPASMGVPAVTMRLTRLDPSPNDEKEHDPRIAQTIQQLRNMGVDVQLGERLEQAAADAEIDSPPRWEPTTHVNLDLSVLIAMVSDLTHAPLPTSAQQAESRFTPGPHYVEWKKKRTALLGDAVDDQTDAIVRPSRALVQQAAQEMQHALFEGIFTRTASLSRLEFWTTHEARDRCLEIVSKIGGPNEKRRAEILFSLHIDPTHATQEFWRGSRYPSGYVPLFPIRLLPSGLPEEDSVPPARAGSGKPLSPFFQSLANTCRETSSKELSHPRLTAHTVQSMLWGATKGWTTLTANKASVKALLREIKAARNGLLWDIGDTQQASSSSPVDDRAGSVAAIWMVDPRSLAEGMRADFGSA